MGTPHLPPDDKSRPLGVALAVTVAVMTAEIAGGLWTGSLALLADAGHMATDASALALSLFAGWAASRPPDASRSFGYHRIEVLAALANGAALWLVIGVILREAWGRLLAPPAVASGPMLGVALLGLAANLGCARFLKRYARSDLNVRSAYLHVFSDALGSLGAVGAAVVIMATGWAAVDPLASLVICALVGVSSWRLVREAIHILLEGTPPHLDMEAVRAALLELEGVQEVHDLHLWSLSAGAESMTGHLVVRPGVDAQRVLEEGSGMLDRRFGLHHVTLQIELPRA